MDADTDDRLRLLKLAVAAAVTVEPIRRVCEGGRVRELGTDIGCCFARSVVLDPDREPDPDPELEEEVADGARL